MHTFSSLYSTCLTGAVFKKGMSFFLLGHSLHNIQQTRSCVKDCDFQEEWVAGNGGVSFLLFQ